MSRTVDTWQELADVLIQTGELDPVYIWLHKVDKIQGRPWTNRFLTHFLMYYDLGEAVEAANRTTEDDFWRYVTDNYSSFRRGHERRHSKGIVGLKYLDNIKEYGTPSELWEFMYYPTYGGMVHRIQADLPACGIGPYFIWKIMDFYDRCLGRPVDISFIEANKYLPEMAAKCAKQMYPYHPVHHILAMVREYIEDQPAPGAPTRLCSYPEAESILCAMRGYFVTGTYKIGSDLDRRWAELADYPDLQIHLPERIRE